MRYQGRVYKDGTFWLAEIPVLDLMTQGKTRKEAYAMAVDMVETMVDRPGFQVTLYPGKNNTFEIGSSDTRPMVSLLLQRKREQSGLSLSQVADRLGSTSRNAYARYERGTSTPTVEKLNELLHAVAPNTDLVISTSKAAL
jgi:hypothetical protein